MGNFEVKVLEFRGSAYQIGYNQGKQLDPKSLYWMKDFMHVPFDVNETTAVFKSFAPHLLDEIQGLGDALEMSFERALRLFSGYDLPKLEAIGCSSKVTQDYLVRNYDFSPAIYDHQLVFSQPTEAAASAGYTLHQMGRHESVNEHGVATALHFVNNANQVTGFMSSTIVRMMADLCKSTDDCIQLLKELPHACSYNYSIGDQNGNHAVVETAPEKVVVRSGEEALACTNHFQDAGMSHFNRERLGHSKARQEAIDTKHADGEEVFKWFSDPESPMFFEDYEQFFGTLHTFAYLFDEDRLLTKVAKGETLELKFQDWVKGKPIPTNVLKGMMSTYKKA
ncbi:C45 family autoproteolytic acyltransferase/hydrolase [Pseudalkalibacillus sp. Hm43]|uniref:C45 family autoproteolytic acyltransferase/hydolase n=1 Tax=Pseudalkalibacillus sp. Hm43 TaxID=3450742 RepID=UPI003F424225